MTKAVKRCPFCGGEPEQWEYEKPPRLFSRGYSLYAVACKSCECRTSLEETFDEAIEAWNRRAAE